MITSNTSSRIGAAMVYEMIAQFVLVCSFCTSVDVQNEQTYEHELGDQAHLTRDAELPQCKRALMQRGFSQPVVVQRADQRAASRADFLSLVVSGYLWLPLALWMPGYLWLVDVAGYFWVSHSRPLAFSAQQCWPLINRTTSCSQSILVQAQRGGGTFDSIPYSRRRCLRRHRSFSEVQSWVRNDDPKSQTKNHPPRVPFLYSNLMGPD